MKKMWKRFVSLLLACTLLAGMLPLSASAAEKPGETDWISDIITDLEGQGYKDTMAPGTAPMQVGSSDVFMYMYQKGSWVEDDGGNQSYVNDLIVIFQPGNGAGNHSIPDYTQQNPPEWSESKPSAVYFADGVTGIGNYAFASQPSLNNVVFQDASSLTYIGQRAFYDDDNAVFTDEGSANAPSTIDLSNVERMGEYAFYNCDRIKGVELSGNITAEEGDGTVENKIPNHAFNNSGLQTVNIPEGIVTIGDGAFAHTSLSGVGELVLPDGLQTIGDNAFVATMGEGDTSSGITSLTIPSTVTSIGADAFSGRRNLQTVTVKDDKKADTKLNLGDGAFGTNEFTAYATQGSIRDEQHPEIEYSGTIGTKFFLPEDLEKYFVNEVKCYTGDITPMKYVDTEPADCINAGYDIYKTTFNGATSDGKPVELTYHYPIPALGHDYGPITEVERTCEHDNYFEQYCERKNCPNKGVAVGSLRQNQEGPGLFDEKTNEQLSEEELNEYRLQFVKAEGHNWSVKSVVNPNMQEGQATTLYYVCENEEHRNGLDTYDSPFKIPLSGKTIHALTTQSLNDLTNQLAGFSNDGMVEWAAPSDEKFGKAGEINEPVKFTIQTGVTEKWPVFTEAPEGEPNAATGENEKLTVKINVTKDVLDLSGVSIVPNTANVNKPVEVRVSGFEEAEKTGSVEYYVGDKWITEQPKTEGKYKVRVTFKYDEKMYDLPEESASEYPGEGYKLVNDKDSGSVWVEHSFEVSLNKINAVAESISNLTYNGEKQNTLRIYGLEIGQKAVVTTTDKDGTEIKWEYTRQEGDQTTPVEGLSLLSAGTYNVKVVFSFPGEDSYADKEQELTVHIDHKPVEKPVPTQNMSYLPVKTARDAFGGQTSADWQFVDDGTYTHTGINAGSYTAKVKLTSDNYRWADENEDVREIEIPWTISPRQIVAPTLASTYYIYEYGIWRNSLFLTATAHPNYEFVTNQEDHTVKLVFVGNKTDENYDPNAAVAYTAADAYHTNRDDYTVIVTLNNSGNYVWWNGAPQNLTWTIAPATLNLPKIEAEGADYTGEPYDAESLVTVKNDGVTLPGDVESEGYQYSNDATFRSPSNNAPINAGTYYVRQNYTYNNQNYIAQIPYASFTINKATAQMTFTEPKQEKTYTAEGTALQLVEVSGLVGQDTGKEETVKKEVQYSYKYSETKVEDWSTVANSTSIKNPESQKFKEVGYYQITAKWGAGSVSDNYRADPATYTLTIKKAEDQSITLTPDKPKRWTAAEGQTPAKYTITYGEAATFTVIGKAALDNASISYAVNGDSNVVSVDGRSGVVTIHKAGTATITVTAANTANVAGTSVDYTVTVNQAKPTVNTGLTDNKLEVSYTGKPITGYDKATATASVVEGAVQPPEAITYTFYTDKDCTEEFNDGAEGNVPIEVDTYYMKATYPGDKNYTFAESKVVTVTVTEADLNVTATGYDAIYNGQPHDPASITVTGVDGTSFTEGDYTVSYIEKSSDEEQKPSVGADWSSTLQVKDVADSGDYWIKVVIKNDDSYAPYIGSVTVDIDPRSLTVTKTVKPTKEYDGTVNAMENVKFDRIDTGIVGETVDADLISAVYNSANANVDNFIIITYELTADPGTDTDLANYSLDGQTVTPGKEISETVTEVEDTPVGITPAPITVDIKDQEKVYDGSAPTVSNIKDTDWEVTAGQIYQLVSGTEDNLGITLSIASDSDAKDAGAYAIIGEADNKNYKVTFTGNWKGEDANEGHAGTYTIDHRPIDVQIGDTEGFYGDVPVLKGVELTYEGTDEENHRGLAPGENSVPNITLGTGASAQSPVAGYVIYAVDGNNDRIQKDTPVVIGNYNVTFTNEGTYTVKPRPITITIKDHSSKYGAEINGGIADPLSDKDYTVAITAGNTVTGGAIVNGDDLGIALFTTAKKGDNAGTYPISGEAKAESSVVSNYAITWKGENPFIGEGEPDSTKATYTVEKAELTVEAKQPAVYAQYGQETANPLTFTNASTGEEITVDDSNYETLENAVTYTLNPADSLTMEKENKAEGKFTVNVTDTTVTVKVNVAETDNFKAATMITYAVYTSASGSLTVDLPFADLTYTSEEQKLLTGAPTLPDGVVIRYKLGEKGTWTKYSDEAPNNWQSLVGTDAGDYTVYWETKAGGNYNASSGHETTEIKKADLSATYTGLNGSEVTLVLSEMGDTYTIPLDLTGNKGYTHSNGDGVTFLSGNTDVAIAKNSTVTLELRGVAGEAKITINCPGDNNYNPGTFTFTVTVTDQKAEIKYNVTGTTTTYNGQPQTIKVEVSEPDSGATVMYWNEETKAYDLSEPPAYTDVQDGGYTIKFQITAPGYEIEEGTATLKINPRDISQCRVEGIAESYTFVNRPIEPQTVEVVDGSVILTKDKDYTIDYGENTEIGEDSGSVTISGMGNYMGSVKKNFTISPVDASDLTASLDRTFGYYGDSYTNNATVTVTHGSHPVTSDGSNTVSIAVKDNTGADVTNQSDVVSINGQTVTFNQVGTYTIEVTVTGNHETNAPIKLTYALLPVEEGELVLKADNETSVVETYGDTVNGTITVTDASGTPMRENTDYTLTYTYTPFEGAAQDSKPYDPSVMSGTPAAGMYVVTATGQGGYANSVGTFTFLILQRDLSKAILDVNDTDLVFNHDEKKPDVTVAVTGNPTADDYTITYYNNVNASKEAKAVVTATGNNFTGSKTADFTIAPKPIAKCAVENIPAQFYTGEPVIPPVTITDGNYTLILGYDYTTACTNKGPGEATVTITGTGNYTGEVEKTFTIKSEGAPEPSERFDLVVTPSQWTWGDDLTDLRLSVTFGTDKELTLGTEYTLEVNGQTFDGTTGKTKDNALTYIKGLKPGKYTITATGMDAYAGSTDTETVTIQRIQPTVTVTATPNSLSGGGKVTLTLKGEKLPNGTDLKTLLSVTAKNDNDVTLEDLHIQWPEDGSLTAELTLPNTNETYTFALRFAGDEYYEPASSDAMVVVGQQTSGGGGGSDPGDQPADPDDTGVSDWLNTKDHLAYLAGYPGGTFGPDQNMTRAEAAQMFYNLLLEKDVEITVEFEDVPADAWYAKPVNTLASLGILSGVGNGRFDPERSITRAEFTVIAMKFANTSGGGVNIFSDVNEDDWFYSAVVDSTQYGWINGYPDGTFRPEATISRAEVTVIVNHMLGRAADRPYVIAHEEELNTFGDVNRGHWGYFHVAEATNAHEYHTEDGTESWTGLS